MSHTNTNNNNDIDYSKFVQMPEKKYPALWELYKKHQSTLWIAEEIPYNADKSSWEKLNEEEKKFIKFILAFFVGADGIVLENLFKNFLLDFDMLEAEYFYTIQAYMEGVHAETYSLLLDTFVEDKDEKTKLFNAISEIPCIKRKADWALKWMNKDLPKEQRLIAFVIVEGIFFSGPFCAIFWLKHRNLMTKALGLSNQWISRDEGLHGRFGVTLYHILNSKVPENIVYEMFKEAIDIEIEFITESLPCDLIMMNKELMIQHIHSVADSWLSELQYKKIYNVQTPFDFMVMSQIEGKTNFFEQGVTEYVNSHSLNSASNRELVISEDF